MICFFFKELPKTTVNVVGGMTLLQSEIKIPNDYLLLSIGDALLKIGDNDVSSYGVTIESIEEDVIRFSAEYVDNNLHNIYSYGDILQFEKQEKQYIQNVYSIALECGFNPDDFETRDENTDFVGQDIVTGKQIGRAHV